MTTGKYFTTHDVKVKFCMQEFSSSKIILHRFHVDNNKGESGVGYNIIFGSGQMLQIELMANFKRQVLQWDSAAVSTKEPSSLPCQNKLTSR